MRRNIVQMHLYIYLSVSIPVQGSAFILFFLFFFLPDSFIAIYGIAEAGPGKKKKNLSFCIYKPPQNK